MLITMFYQFSVQKSAGVLQRIGSLSLTVQLVMFEQAPFRFICKTLNHVVKTHTKRPFEYGITYT